MLHLVVDAANVVGSRPDGWWRDRAGAARRLAGSIVAVLVSRPEDLVELLDGTTPDSAETAGSDLAVAAVQVHLVLEGAAGAVEDMPTHPLLDVVHAPADGDSAIVDLVGELVGGPGRVLVVTADRALRARVHAAGAEVTGPGTFRAALPEAGRATLSRGTRAGDARTATGRAQRLTLLRRSYSSQRIATCAAIVRADAPGHRC